MPAKLLLFQRILVTFLRGWLVLVRRVPGMPFLFMLTLIWFLKFHSSPSFKSWLVILVKLTLQNSPERAEKSWLCPVAGFPLLHVPPAQAAGLPVWTPE